MTLRLRLLLLALAPLLFAPRVAHACGGFFCNSQPIAQSGEKILFSLESDGSVTAYVQIAYTGPSTDFAWILPVPSAPDITVGTQALLDQLATQTTPSFVTTSTTSGVCHGTPVCRFPVPYSLGGCGCGGASAAFDGHRGASVDMGLSTALPPVEIISQNVVGPYDTVTLTGSDVNAIHDWLTANGYLFPDTAIAGLEPYVAKHDAFVALKLSKDANTGDLAPVVLHYASGQPCIPIILTAIATVPDMPVVAFFLADAGVTPTNYLMTEVDLGQHELWDGRLTWTDAVSAAVDEAGHHAFVTDYRGTVPSLSLELATLDDLRSVTDVGSFFQSLQSRGYNQEPQILPVLLHALPPPPGATPRDFYNCLARGYCPEYDSYLATLHFDPSALVDAIEAAITTPRHEATLLLARHTHLTRLFTTLSAAEMTMDPEFGVQAALPEVPAQRRGTIVTECSAAYAPDFAPQRLDVGTLSMPWRDGHAYTTDDDYCRAIGGDGAAHTSISVSGFTPGSAMPRTLVVAGLAVVVLARRLRRRRR